MRNFLFISIDDLNDWTNDLGGYSGVVHTPNLDALMASGVTFNNAYSQVALCNPSRISILSGKSPLQTQVFSNGEDWEKTVDPSETLFGVMKANGYQSVGTGKLLHGHRFSPAQNMMFDSYFFGGGDNTRVNLDGKPVGVYNGTEPLADEIRADFVVDFLQNYTSDPNNPLFMSVGLIKPHTEWVVPQRFFDLYPLDSIR
ncbi:sulfatase-like hydrolase/transferase [Pleurocapsa sp. PCC 7319]|uniref:sulfatase-like hydrolase/transferase n=1 Tax=Pleurocapsa sp. PCC 7319 TaxID=118161 RepID=UPI00034B2DB7|nr:sulfatase-like hydrolase/transferase [Pleurocapsa sp. PCC 7319]